jgi:hypothetical protein
MRRFSRWMPPLAKTNMGLTEWLALVALLASVVTLAVAYPLPAGMIAATVIVLLLIGHIRSNRHLRRLADQRPGEHIGTFARSFDRRFEMFDPWVVRATWDALQPFVTFCGGQVPLRPTDRLGEDLCIDPDDVDLDLLPAVADRAGYTLDQTEANPHYGKVATVGDFVRLIQRQPRR